MMAKQRVMLTAPYKLVTTDSEQDCRDLAHLQRLIIKAAQVWQGLTLILILMD